MDTTFTMAQRVIAILETEIVKKKKKKKKKTLSIVQFI